MRISDWSSDVCSSDLWRVGIGIFAERLAQHPHRGDAIDHRMMDLGVDREATILQTFDDVKFPQRPRPIKRHRVQRSDEHTSELQSLMRISYAVFCLKKKKYHYKRPLTMNLQISRLFSLTATLIYNHL